LLDPRVDFITVRQRIDELGFEGLWPQKGPTVDEGPYGTWVETACRGNALDDLAELRLHDALGGFAMWRCIVALREGIHKVLVFLTVIQTGHQVKLVECATHERRLSHQPRQADIAGGLQLNGIEGGGQIVGPVPSGKFPKCRSK